MCVLVMLVRLPLELRCGYADWLLLSTMDNRNRRTSDRRRSDVLSRNDP